MKKKVKVAIIGTGNIGSDLLVKINRSQILECGIFTGNNLTGINKRFRMSIFRIRRPMQAGQLNDLGLMSNISC